MSTELKKSKVTKKRPEICCQLLTFIFILKCFLTRNVNATKPNTFWFSNERVRKASVSVTRFGEMLPLWQKFTSLWQIFDCLFLIWQNAEPTFANLWHYWAIFHCCKWPNIEKQSNHLVTLVGERWKGMFRGHRTSLSLSPS